MRKNIFFMRIKSTSLFTGLLMLFFMLTNFKIVAQDNEGSKVKWMSLTDAMEKVKKEPRPILLDFYTDWCGWCKQMMKTTYADVNLASYINTYFYPAKFNAESKDTIEYLGKKYGPMSMDPKSPHELAVTLLSGKLMYPTTLFLSGYDKEKNSFALNMIAAGYLDIIKIQPILIYALENVYRNSSIDDFTNEFNKANNDSSIDKKMEAMKWLKPITAFADSSLKKRKTIVFINTQWCNSCKVMKRTSFTDSLNYDYFKRFYDCIDFDAETLDTINFKGQQFINPHTPQQNLHQLSLAFTKTTFTVPTIIFLDEHMNYLDAVPGYLPPVLLNEISHFYGDDGYKKKPWIDYYKEAEEKRKK